METIKEITITKTDDGYKIAHTDGDVGGITHVSTEVGEFLFNMLIKA